MNPERAVNSHFQEWRTTPRLTPPAPPAGDSCPLQRARTARRCFLRPQRCASTYAPPQPPPMLPDANSLLKADVAKPSSRRCSSPYPPLSRSHGRVRNQYPKEDLTSPPAPRRNPPNSTASTRRAGGQSRRGTSRQVLRFSPPTIPTLRSSRFAPPFLQRICSGSPHSSP